MSDSNSDMTALCSILHTAAILDRFLPPQHRDLMSLLQQSASIVSHVLPENGVVQFFEKCEIKTLELAEKIQSHLKLVYSAESPKVTE